MELDTIIQGDCLEVMKDWPENCVDLVLTDPPYRMNHSTGGCTNSAMKEKWQGNIKAGNVVMDFSTSIKFDTWVPEVFRVLKRGSHAYIFVNDKNMRHALNAAESSGFGLSNILIWHKNNCTPNRYYMKNAEFVIFLHKKPATIIRNMGTKTLQYCENIPGKNKKHSTEKPIDLLQIYILNSTTESMLVLDPFCGSGTTLKACQNLNRNYIGIDISEEYCKIARMRIKAVDTGVPVKEQLAGQMGLFE